MEKSEGLLVKVQSHLPWKAQETGKANTTGSPPRMAASVEWRESKSGTSCVVLGGGAAGVDLPFEARRSQVSSRYWSGSYRMWAHTAEVWLGSD